MRTSIHAKRCTMRQSIAGMDLRQCLPRYFSLNWPTRSGAQFHTIHGRTNAILLPYVIRYNGTRPAKTATWPKYNYYRADEKYQDIARMLGLPCSTPEEAVEAYAKAVYELGERVGIEMNFKAQGIDEKEWKKHSRELAFLAYEDQCSPANPRLPMVDHMQEIIEDAYYGYKERPGRRK